MSRIFYCQESVNSVVVEIEGLDAGWDFDLDSEDE